MHRQYQHSNAEHQAFLMLLGVVIAYFLYFSYYQLQRYQAFWTNIDVTNMEQTIWNTLHGDFMRATIYPPTGAVIEDFSGRQTEHRWSSHVQILPLVLALPYAIVPRTETLLVLMCMSVAASAIPFFRLAQRRLKSPWAALLFAIGYLLIPMVQTNNSWDVHGLTFLPFFLLAALDAAENDRRFWWWFWILLAMGCREDIPFLAGWAMLWLAPRKHKREAVVMFIVGLTLSWLNFVVIIPAFGGGGGTPYIARFLPADVELTRESMMQLFRQGAFWRQELRLFVSYNVRLGLPVLFFHWLYWPALLAIAPLMFTNGLSWYTGASFPSLFHYSAPAMPWVMVGAVEGFVRLERLFTCRWPQWRWRNLMAEALIVTILISSYMEGYLPWSRAFIWPELSGREPAMATALELVPEDAVLSAEMQLLSHQAQRETLRFFPDTREADWILLDFWFGLYPYQSMELLWPQVRDAEQWETVLADNGLLFLRQGQGPPEDLQNVFHPSDELTLPTLRVRFGTEKQGLYLEGLQGYPRPVNYLFLCSDWRQDVDGNFTPYVELRGATTESATPLRAKQLLPMLFTEPDRLRDCTPLLANLRGSGPVIRLSVRDEFGRTYAPTLLDAGAWGERVRVDPDGLLLYFPPWW